jgi:4-hydroxy-tetrahydrodipicolinate synthase
MHRFAGIWVPLVTPFAPDGAVDFLTLRRLVFELREAAVAGLVVFGTTGEPATLRESDKRAILKCVADASEGTPIVVGASGITASEVCAQLAALEGFALAGALITPPYYVRPSQQAIAAFFEEIAAATQLPLIVYDIPYRTGVQVELDTFRDLTNIPTVCGVKDCGGDARKTQALIADGRLSVLAGEDHLIFNTIAQGGAGAIAASAHLHPRLFVEMHRALNAGAIDRARELHHALAPLIAALAAEPNPAPVKSVLASLGFGHDAVRKPLLPASARVARHALDRYHAIAGGSLQASPP